MTRRLIQLDLTTAEARAMALALDGMAIAAKADGEKRNAATALRAKEKLESAWQYRGREGRGLNTKTIERLSK